MTKENFYEKYIAELLIKANLVEKDQKPDDEYIKKLANELEKKIGIMIFNELSKEDMEEYAKLVDEKANSKQLNIFFSEHIKDFEQKRSQALEDFAMNFFQRTAKLRESLK